MLNNSKKNKHRRGKKREWMFFNQVHKDRFNYIRFWIITSLLFIRVWMNSQSNRFYETDLIMSKIQRNVLKNSCCIRNSVAAYRITALVWIINIRSVSNALLCILTIHLYNLSQIFLNRATISKGTMTTTDSWVRFPLVCCQSFKYNMRVLWRQYPVLWFENLVCL